VIDSGLEAPQEAAGWYHDYVCVEHGVPLELEIAGRRHWCATGRHFVVGEGLDEASRWCVNDALANALFGAAILARVDDDATCRDWALRTLLAYAARYGAYLPRPGAGRATAQPLDEAIWLIRLAWAYSWLREGASADDRRTLEEGLFTPAVAHLCGARGARVHNIEIYVRAAIGTCGKLLLRSDWVDCALEGEHGLCRQLRDGVRSDGLWWEGSPAYHYFALWGFMWAARAMPELWAEDALRRMLLAPLDLASSSGELPALNDGWRGIHVTGNLGHGVPRAESLYEIAVARLDVAPLTELLASIYRTRPRDSVEALLYGADELLVCAERSVGPGASFEASGYAVFRPASTSDDGLDYVFLKYGPQGGIHDHPDKLSLELRCGDLPVACDLGSSSYGLPLTKYWYRSTMAHNTVAIDWKSQPRADGKLLAFRAFDTEAYGLVEAEVSWKAREPYAGVTFRRLVCVRPSYCLDLFWVRCPTSRVIDHLFRCDHAWSLACELQPRDSAPWLLGPDRTVAALHPIGALDAAVHALTWTAGDRRFDVSLSPWDAERFVAEVPGNPSSDRDTLLLRRCHGRSACFGAVYRSGAHDGPVASVSWKQTESGLLIAVALDGGLEQWTVRSAEPGAETAATDVTWSVS